MVTKVEGWGGLNREFGIRRDTRLCINNKALMYSPGNSISYLVMNDNATEKQKNSWMCLGERGRGFPKNLTQDPRGLFPRARGELTTPSAPAGFSHQGL